MNNWRVLITTLLGILGCVGLAKFSIWVVGADVAMLAFEIAIASDTSSENGRDTGAVCLVILNHNTTAIFILSPQ